MTIDDETRFLAEHAPLILEGLRRARQPGATITVNGVPIPLDSPLIQAVAREERKALAALALVGAAELRNVKPPGRPSRREMIRGEYDAMHSDERAAFTSKRALYAELRKRIKGRGKGDPRGLGEAAMEKALRDRLSH